MRHYEIVFLVHPDQSEQVPAMMDRYREMVASGEGRIHRAEDWGRRRLAYSINDVHKAHYVLFNVECSLDVLAEIKRNFKFNDSILRHLVVRRKQAVSEESPFAKAKAEEERQEEEKRKAAEARAKADEDANDKDKDKDTDGDEGDGDDSGGGDDGVSGGGDETPDTAVKEPDHPSEDAPDEPKQDDQQDEEQK